jgi:AraC-like DNA-binding protein
LDKRDAITQPAKGIVDPAAMAERVRLARLAPSADLATFVEHLWIVQWAGEPPQVQRTLPYPNFHLVFEVGASGLWGVPRGAFEKRLAGPGMALGLRFRPGGARPFLAEPASAWRGRIGTLEEVFGWNAEAVAASVLGAGDDTACGVAAEALLRPRLPPPDPAVDLAADVVALAEAAGGPTTATALAKAAGLSLRALQRLFHDHVGVPPKWVIQRFRLQEAAWRLAEGCDDLAGLAAELGFFDQAHFSRDFTRLLGVAPGEYRRRQG